MIEITSLRAFQGSKEIFYIKNLQIPSKGLFLIQGDNGSGKSTLMRCILDLHVSYSGQILVDGYLFKDLSRREIATQVAYLPQLYRSDVHISVRDYIFQGSYASGKSRHEELIDILDLHRLDSDFCNLSGGEQQLVRIARVLGSPANYYFLDEPDSFLSRKNRKKFLSAVNSVGQRSSVVMVSHQEEVGGNFVSLLEWYED